MSAKAAVLDTNILVYALFSDSPHHIVSRRLLDQAASEKAELFLASQSLAEFYAVVTNPRRVRSPKSANEAISVIAQIMELPGLTLLPQPIDVVVRWCELLKTNPVTGGDVFDVQLIATMLASGIHRIYTFNISDFRKFNAIEAVVPTA